MCTFMCSMYNIYVLDTCEDFIVINNLSPSALVGKGAHNSIVLKSIAKELCIFFLYICNAKKIKELFHLT